MTSTTRQAEADRVDVLYYWCLNQLGNAIALDALKEWENIPASSQATRASEWWLTRILKLIFGFRKEAADLAVAYYRLNRALRTGYAPTYGDEQPGDSTTLEELRVAFEEIVDNIDEQTKGDAPPDLNAGDGKDESTWEPVTEHDPSHAKLTDEDGPIELEHVANIDELIKAAEDAAEQEARDLLTNVGSGSLVKKLDKIKADDERREAKIAEAHKVAGSRQASAAMRVAMNAARGLVYSLSETDERVIGWVRYSESGHPCAFCAMLISREVMYKTRAKAIAKERDGARNVDTTNGTAANDADKYHLNCRCTAVPVFSLEQFDNNPLYQQNRDLGDLWDEHIKGEYSNTSKSGGSNDALNAWRKLLRELGISSESTTTAVQAAA